MEKGDRLFIVGCAIAIIASIAYILAIDTIFPSPQIDENAIRTIPMEEFSGIDIGTSPGASVTIIEFSDFECQYCTDAHWIIKSLLSRYGDDINFVFKHYPMHGLDNAIASECAREQGKFMEFADKLFSGNSYQEAADGLGLDDTGFKDCMARGEAYAKVEKDMSEGLLNRIKGTPTFIINGKVVEGSPSEEGFQKIIDILLEDG